MTSHLQHNANVIPIRLILVSSETANRARNAESEAQPVANPSNQISQPRPHSTDTSDTPQNPIIPERCELEPNTSPLTVHKKYSTEYIKRRLEALNPQTTGLYSSTSRSSQRPTLRHFVHKLMIYLRGRRSGNHGSAHSRAVRDSGTVDLTTAHEITLHFPVNDINVEELLKVYAMMMSKYGRNRFPANPQDYHLYLYDAVSRKGRRVLSNAFLLETIGTWQGISVQSRLRYSIRKVIVDLAKGLHESSGQPIAAASMGLWQLCSSNERWLDELSSMRAATAYLNSGICHALNFLVGDDQRRCLLLGALWQLVVACSLVNTQQLAPVLLHSLAEDLLRSASFEPKKCVYMTLGVLLTFEPDAHFNEANTLRTLVNCVVACQENGNHEGLVAALKLISRHVKPLMKFLHEAVPIRTLSALVSGLSLFKQTPLSTTLLQATLLVNISTYVKPTDDLVEALGSFEMFHTLLGIAQRAMQIKQSPSVDLLRHGVCRLFNAWLLISPFRLEAAANKSHAQGVAEFITKHVGSTKLSEQEFAATECLLNVHCWLCEAGRCARLAELSAKVIISRLKFSKHEKSFRSITDRVRKENEYRSLLESNVLVVLLRRVADSSSRGRMRGLVRMLFGCIANTDATDSNLSVSVFDSLLDVLVDDTTEHEDRQGLVCSLLVAFRNAALSSQVVESKQDYLPSLIHCLRYFVDDFTDPYFEMLLYIIWSFVDKPRFSWKSDAGNRSFRFLLAHLHGSVERMQSAVETNRSHRVNSNLVNISFESEVQLWSVVSFKRSLLELNAAGAKQRVSRILGFYETRDEAIDALIAYESAAEEKRLKRVFKDKAPIHITGKIRLQRLDEPSTTSDRVRMLLSVIWSMYMHDKNGCGSILRHPETTGILFYLGLSNRIKCLTVKRIVGRLLWDIILGNPHPQRTNPTVGEEEAGTESVPAETNTAEEGTEVPEQLLNKQHPREEEDEAVYNKHMLFGKPRAHYITRLVHMTTLFAQCECDMLQADVAFYLSTLARKADCRRIVSRHGGIPALMCLVKSAPLRSTTGFNAVVGLGLLCYSRTNQEIISSNGGLETLLGVCRDTLPAADANGATEEAWSEIEDNPKEVGDYDQQRVARWILFVLKQNACNATRLYKAELEGQDVPVQVRREWTFDPRVQEVHKHDDGYSVTVAPNHNKDATATNRPRNFNFTTRPSVKEVERIELDDAEATAMKDIMFCFKKVRGSTLLPKLPTYVAPDGEAFHLCLSGLPEHPCKKIVHIAARELIRCSVEEFLNSLKLSVAMEEKFGARPQSREDLHALHGNWTPTIRPVTPPLPQSMYRFYNVIAQPTHPLLEQVGKHAGRVLPQGNLRFYCVRAVKRSRWSLIKRSFFASMPDPAKNTGAKSQDEFTSIISTYVNTIRRDRSIMRKDFKLILRKPSFVNLVKGSVDTVQWTLCEHASLVLAMFRYFAAQRSEAENAFVLNKTDFQFSVSQMNLGEERVLPLNRVDEVFEQACDRTEAEISLEARSRLEGMKGKLQQHEFIEAIIRLAPVVFPDNPLSVALHLLIAQRMWGRFATERVLDLDAFRYMVLHSKDVNRVLIQHKKMLVSLFDHFAGKIRLKQETVEDSSESRLSLQDWLEFVKQFKLVNELNVSLHDCTLCFALTILNTSSQAQSEDETRSFSLDFTRFSEAMCRVCGLMVEPPKNVLERCSTLPEAYAFMRNSRMKSQADFSWIRLQTCALRLESSNEVRPDLGKKLAQLLPLIENQLSSILLVEDSKHVLDEKYHLTVEVPSRGDEQNA